MLLGGVFPTFSESSGDAEVQIVLQETASTLQYSLGLREELLSRLAFIGDGDIRGALKFLFASRDAKPCGVKEIKKKNQYVYIYILSLFRIILEYQDLFYHDFQSNTCWHLFGTQFQVFAGGGRSLTNNLNRYLPRERERERTGQTVEVLPTRGKPKHKRQK